MIAPEALKQRLMNHQVIPIKFAQQRMLLDASGVLIWPSQDVMIFSDLHLEKGSFLSQFASPLPRFDSRDTLIRMAQMIAVYDCQKVVCLGDSLHDGNALSRMQPEDLCALNQMVASAKEWTWILGNHDPEIPPAIKGTRAPYLEIAGVLLVHEPEDLKDFKHAHAQIIGHYHPKSSHKISNRKVTGKCFICANTILLMPAYGKYTGGLDIQHEAFMPMLANEENSAFDIYLIYHHKIYML